MQDGKPAIFAGFLRFSRFSSLFQKSHFRKNKKMQNAIFDLPPGTGPVDDHFRAVFRGKSSRKTALFINYFLLQF
jgi:hypothetical protein